MAPPPDALAELERTWSRPPGLRGFLMEVNNQPLGKRFMITSMAFFAVAGVMALVMRIQLAVSDNEWLDPDLFNVLFTMHGSTMMYLFVVPFLEGLGLYLMPMMIGSRDVAFPRLTAFSYWMYLFGGLIMYASIFSGNMPDAGWFAYTPLSGPQFSGIGLDFWLLGLGLVEIAAIAAGVEIVVTILKMRAPGMAIHRMPLLVWSFLIAGVMIIFGITPLFLATVLLEMDRGFGTHFFNPDAGGSSLLWQHIFWFFGHPDVYIIFIPATGVISSVIPVFARRPIVGYTLIVVALLITGFLSFGLWVHHMFATGLPQLSLVFFAAASFMIALASGAQVFAWIATLWASRPLYQTPLLYILGFFFTFVIGGITGVMIATIPFDLQVHDSYFIVAHFHYVLIGGVVFPIFAGIYYWFPKFSGRMPIEPWGKIGFWLTFLGFNATFLPMHHMGMFGMSRRVYTYPAELGLDAENLFATIAAFVLGLGFAIALFGLIWSLWRGTRAERNPWNGSTLEWAMESPPRSYGFRQPPVVHSRDPLWRDQPRVAEMEEGIDTVGPDTAPGRDAAPDADALDALAEQLRDTPAHWRATLITDMLTARPQALQWLPGPTTTPLITALGFVTIAVGVLMESHVLAVAAAVFAFGMVAFWVRPVERVLAEEQEIQERLNLPLRPAGSRSSAWCGVVCLLAVLAVVLGGLLYAYFYLWLYSETWPQGEVPLPQMFWPGAAHAALAASALLQGWVSWSFRRGERRHLRVAVLGVLVVGLSYVIIQCLALAYAGFGPTENAYTSAFFVLNWTALAFAGTGLAMIVALLPRLLRHRHGVVQESQLLRLHLEIAELFWFFVVAAGLLVFVSTHLSPYVL